MVKSINKLFFLLFLSLPLFCFSHEEYVVRAAVDIGSGATKLKIAQINLKTQKIEKVLFNESFPVQYQEELEKSPNETFNEHVMQTGLDALKKSKEIAKRYNAQNVVAVATASFRKAKNVQEFIDKIDQETGIKVYIIDQHLEGVLGFEATTAQCSAHPRDVVVWDIGGGSFQFTCLDEEGKITVYRGVDASIPFKNHVIKFIKMEDPQAITTPNPLTQPELQVAVNHARQISKKVDDFFKKKLSQAKTKVVGIGNIFVYRIYPLIDKKSPFMQRELSEKVHCLDGKTDQDLDVGNDPYVNVSVTNPILILGFMQTLGIHQMDIMDINNADGALLYPGFWEKTPSLKAS